MTNEKEKIVLHADDDPTIRLVLGKILKSTFPDAKIEPFEDGTSLEKRFLQAPQADLVVTDNSMPRLTGLDFIQRYSRLVPVPIILVSGDYGIEQKAKEYGVAAYLQKPFELKEFVETVRQILYPFPR